MVTRIMVRSIFLHRKHPTGTATKRQGAFTVEKKSSEPPADELFRGGAEEKHPPPPPVPPSEPSVSHNDDDDNDLAAVAVPAFAWLLQTRLVQQSQVASFRASVLQWQDYILGLAVIVASVFYGRLYDGFPQLDWRNPNNNDYRHIALYWSTIAVPAYLTLLQRLQQASHNPCRQWKALTKALSDLDSEIFQFRVRAGLYHTEKDLLGVFTLRIQVIYRSIESYLSIQRQVDDSFWVPPTDEVLTQPVERRPSPSSPSPPPSYDEWLQELPQGSFDQVHRQGGAVAKESTPLLFSGEEKHHCFDDDLEKAAIVSPSAVTRPEELVPIDDKISRLSIGEYVKFRLEAQMHMCEQEVARATCRHLFLQRLIQILSLSTSVISALSLQWSVPIVWGVVTVLTRLELGWGKWDTYAETALVAFQTLTEIQQWWASLNTSDQELPAMQDRLVETTERALAHKMEVRVS